MSTPVNRIEVVTRAERQRRWNDADKMRILNETLTPGATVIGVSKRYGLSTGQIYTWRRQAREGGLGGFVPVIMDRGIDTPKPMSAPAANLAARAPMIEIRTRTMSVRVHSGAEAELVERIVQVLKADG